MNDEELEERLAELEKEVKRLHKLVNVYPHRVELDQIRLHVGMPVIAPGKEKAEQRRRQQQAESTQET